MAKNLDVELGDIDIVGQTVRLLLAGEVKGRDRFYHPSIFKVPDALRDVCPSSYNPRVVSIGPLHREAKKVQAFEARKATYLHNLLGCLELPLEPTMEACVQKVTYSIKHIRGSYDEMKSYTDVELAQMMIMDGFFILEFFYNCKENYIDSFLGTSIINDLLLLENQIPFLVLQDLFDRTILKCQPNASLIGLILNVLQDVKLFVNKLREENVLRTPDHILGLLHMCYRPNEDIRSRISNSTIHSAVELERAGVRFKPTQDPSWPMAIEVESSKFGCFSWSWGKPTLRMPVMRIQDRTESTMRNLIVYEQSSTRVNCYITSYAIALDNLVDTKMDIALLVESGVLINCIGSNEDAANIINNIGKRIITNDYYTEQWDKLDEYYNGYWTKNLAHLSRTYFSSPWNIIAVLAGIILFALTIVQTIFTIKAANLSALGAN